MLIIGHRGAAGLAPENTLEALQVGFDNGSDILEFDIRVTSDGIPILAHDPWIKGKRISRSTLLELKEVAAITTLDQVLTAFFGKIILNIELKRSTDADIVADLVSTYIKHDTEWDDIIFSSFKPRALYRLQSFNSKTNLALLHHINPFLFMRHHKQLNLSAVGFHRLHANPLALTVAQKLGIFTYVYTVDRTDSAKRFARRQIDGIVTNRPDRISESLQKES